MVLLPAVATSLTKMMLLPVVSMTVLLPLPRAMMSPSPEPVMVRVLVTGIGVIERRINRKRSLPRERRLNGHGRAVEVHHELGLCCGRGIRAGSQGRCRRRQEQQRLGPIQMADEMLVAVGIDPLEVRLQPEIGHLRREMIVV